MARHKISCKSVTGFEPCDCGIEERRQREEHNDEKCPNYNEPVLPDEEGKCSLCGARLLSEEVHEKN
ncbi:MAG: hypothetical protein ACRDFB_03665 [Rhabdochlamydiaceae bacterium]